MESSQEASRGTKSQLNLRVPTQLREQLTQYAVACGMSMNMTAALIIDKHLRDSGYPGVFEPGVNTYEPSAQ